VALICAAAGDEIRAAQRRQFQLRIGHEVLRAPVVAFQQVRTGKVDRQRNVEGRYLVRHSPVHEHHDLRRHLCEQIRHPVALEDADVLRQGASSAQVIAAEGRRRCRHNGIEAAPAQCHGEPPCPQPGPRCGQARQGQRFRRQDKDAARPVPLIRCGCVLLDPFHARLARAQVR